MNNELIQLLIEGKKFPDHPDQVELIETHISWILLSKKFAFKIKKPLTFSFLDFSTLDKRHHYCIQEYELNKRLAPDMYLGVLPIRKSNGQLSIGSKKGDIIDYAVFMKRMDYSKQMDVLLDQNQVSEQDIQKIAMQVAKFHQGAKVIQHPMPAEEIHQNFADLSTIREYVGCHLGLEAEKLIEELIQFSKVFTQEYRSNFQNRARQGYIIDGHGDLHSRNIFLLEDPVIFDCIEFNDEHRHVDVLSDLAFFCMDLEFRKRPDFASLFMTTYLSINPCMSSKEDQLIFLYYKLYRANVRLKVSAISAKQKELENEDPSAILEDIKIYFHLIKHYLHEIDRKPVNSEEQFNPKG